jgi:hypothetical protein
MKLGQEKAFAGVVGSDYGGHTVGNLDNVT